MQARLVEDSPFFPTCQRGRELRRPCKSEDTGERPVAGSIVPVAQSSRGTASRTQRLGVQVPPGIRPQKRGLCLKVGRLSYTQEEREHYLQPLRFSFECGIGPKARSQYAKLDCQSKSAPASLQGRRGRSNPGAFIQAKPVSAKWLCMIGHRVAVRQSGMPHFHFSIRKRDDPITRF